MKKYLFLFLIGTLVSSAANGAYYILAKSGLNLRAEANTSSKVLTTVAYGEEVTVLSGYEGNITIDGMNGNWAKVKYKGSVGFLVSLYLTPHKAPVGAVESLDDYFNQVSTVAFKTEAIKNEMRGEDDFSSIQKTLYKNGMEIHSARYYEAAGDTYFFPHWQMETAFLLLKQIKHFNIINEYAIAYPTSNKVYKKGEKTVDVKVSENKIVISYEEGAIYDIIISYRDNQVIVEFFSGV